MNIEALQRYAALSIESEHAPKESRGNFLGISVREHDACVISAQLKCDVFEGRSSGFEDTLAGLCRAGESDFAESGM